MAKKTVAALKNRNNNAQAEAVWEDTSSGLMWQVGPTGGGMTRSSAFNHCDNLNYAGYSDWRLPSISELRTLILGCDNTKTGGSCAVTDSCLSSGCWTSPCAGCVEGGCYWSSQIDGDCSWYWSSSPYTDISGDVWIINFADGSISNYNIGFNDVRCVR